VRGKHDAGNHCVAQFTWTSLLMTYSQQIPSLLRRGCIKRSHSTLDLLNKDSLECLKQGRASLPNRQNLQSVTNFKDRDGSCPNGCARLFVEPFDNTPGFGYGRGGRSATDTATSPMLGDKRRRHFAPVALPCVSPAPARQLSDVLTNALTFGQRCIVKRSRYEKDIAVRSDCCWMRRHEHS
jgi:hypothetical protein